MESECPNGSSQNSNFKSGANEMSIEIENPDTGTTKDHSRLENGEAQPVENDSKLSPTPPNQLCDYTHRASGDKDRPLNCSPLVAAEDRLEWLKDLDNEGYAGLLYADLTSLHDQAGYELFWWFRNRNIIDRLLVKTPLEETAAAGIMVAKTALPDISLLESVMGTIAEIIGSNKSAKFIVTTPQLFLPSTGGFSQYFRHEETHSEPEVGNFRCFRYFCPTDSVKKGGHSHSISSPDRQGIFIGSAVNTTKVFGTDRVVTLKILFGEADRKFRLHRGDVLVMKSSYPFAVDLLVGGRAEGCRVLSWLILREKDNDKFPVVMPMSEGLMSIDSITSTDEVALNYRNQEFDRLEINPGAAGDPNGRIQRLRVTPRVYEVSEILQEVEDNDNSELSMMRSSEIRRI